MCGKKFLQDRILIVDRLQHFSMLDNGEVCCRHLLSESLPESGNFNFQGPDVLLFALAVGSLCLPIQFLSSCQGRPAVWLGTASFGGLTI